MASQRPAGLSGGATHRKLLISALPIVLLLGTATSNAQSSPLPSPSFQSRIEEVVRMLEDYPRLKGLTEQQRKERVEFVVGNVLFMLVHEMGHVHISEMHLPVLGREEDAADAHAALTLLKMGTGFSRRVLIAAAKGWFLSDRRDQQTHTMPAFYDEHGLSQQRAYQIVCLMVGSDREKFNDLADETHLPQSRRDSCKEDYAQASWSWDTVLNPYRRGPDQPMTKIDVIYGEGKDQLDVFEKSFRAVRLLDAVAERAESDFVWPSPFTIEAQTCGRQGAHWDDKTRKLTLCYESAFDFAELYRAYVPPTAAVQKRKSK